MICSAEIFYTVEYDVKPSHAPSLEPVFNSSFKGFDNVYVVTDNWYYASRERADSCHADAFIIPGGSTSDVPFYDGSLDSYVELLRDPGRPTIGFCAGLQFLCMARGGICAYRSEEHGNITATRIGDDEIFEGSPNPYVDRANHSMSIADPPPEYRVLAVTRTCYVTFIRHLTMPLYGSQLHIESGNDAPSAGPAILHNFRYRILPRSFHGIAEAQVVPGEAGAVRLTWWKARTEAATQYLIFQATSPEGIDFENADYQTEALEYKVSGLNPQQTYSFAVRAVAAGIEDSNRAVYPIIPDGHRTAIFQNGRAIDGRIYDESAATVISSHYPDSNFGQRGAPGKDVLYWWDSGLLQFSDLERYLAGKKIIDGRLTFLIDGGVTDYTNADQVANIRIYRIKKAWSEGLGYNLTTARQGEVTWNSARYGEENWEIPGGRGESDRDAWPIASFTVKGDGTGNDFDGTVMLPAQLIQDWVDHPENNHGLLYEKEDNYPRNFNFRFYDNDDEWFMNHPRLIVYYQDNETTDLTPESVELPQRPQLYPNYPNPFNPSTRMSFYLPRAGKARLTVVDLLGRELRILSEGRQTAGQHSVEFCADGLAGGIYFYRLETEDGFSQTQKMLFIK